MAFVRELTMGKHKWPESIDFDRSGNLYFSDHREKVLFRIRRNSHGAPIDTDESPGVGKRLDGPRCLENGDLLVSSFYSEAFSPLRWNGRGYEKPTVIRDTLDCTTAAALGQSANRGGESLLVTTTKGFLRSFLGGGAILEIPNIRELIGSK